MELPRAILFVQLRSQAEISFLDLLVAAALVVVLSLLLVAAVRQVHLRGLHPQSLFLDHPSQQPQALVPGPDPDSYAWHG